MIGGRKVKSIWLILTLLIVALSVTVFLITDKKRSAEKYIDSDFAIWESVGFVACGNPVETASGINAHFDSDGKLCYDVYLPVDEGEEIELVCDEGIEVTVGNETYTGGDVLNVPLFERLNGEIDVPGVGTETADFRFIAASGIPSVYLGTYNDTKDFLKEVKGNTAAGFCTVLNGDDSKDYSGNCNIRVHGNSSFFFDKSSYQFNLESDVGILGMPAQRKWVLISEFIDGSFMKDAIMYRLSKNTGDKYSPEFRYVNVYLNGQYEGLYLLLQKVDIDGGNIDLNNLEVVNNVAGDRKMNQNNTGGYLVELGAADAFQDTPENLIVETPNRWMEVKSPSNLTEDQHKYLTDLVNEAEQALYLSDGEKTGSGKAWSDYYDPESWMRQYVFQEISINYDTEYNSEFFHIKENDRKLYGGPAWDFDKSINDYVSFIQNERLNYMIRSIHNNSIAVKDKDNSGIMWLKQFDSHKDFHDGMKKFFFEKAEPQLKKILSEDVPVWEKEIEKSAIADAYRWSGEDIDEPNDPADSFANSVKKITGVFADRTKFLDAYYKNEDAYYIVTFVLDEARIDLMVPVKKGDTIGEDVLPIYNDSNDWYYGKELFTPETVVTKDMVLTQKQH